MTNDDSHDPLRDLIHQSLVSDKLTPSAELRTELEQRLASSENSDEVVVSPAKPEPEKKPRRRIVRAWHMALVVTAELAVMVYLSLPERWQRMVAVNGWTSYPQAQRADWQAAASVVDSVSGKSKRLESEGLAEFENTAGVYDRRVRPIEDNSTTATDKIIRDPSDYGVRGALEQGSGSKGVTPRIIVQEDEGKGLGYAKGKSGRPEAGDTGPTTFESTADATSPKPTATTSPQQLMQAIRGGVGDPGFNNRSVGGIAVRPEGEITTSPELEKQLQDQYAKVGRVARSTGFPEEAKRREIQRAQAELAVEQAARRSALSTLETKLALITADGDKAQERDKVKKEVQELREGLAALQRDEAYRATFAAEETRTAEFLAKNLQREQLAQAETEKLLKLTSDLKSKQLALGPKHPKVLKLTEEITQVAGYVEKLHDALAIEMAPGSEQYAPIHDNPFLPAKDAPLSTFSIDVDTASYANVRRFLTQGQVPPADAVRIEELLNYFSYDYPAPKGDEPFSVNMETAPCPWQADHLLLRVGLKGKEVHKQERPASNLVFLIDTSGSMSDEDKLPLVKQAMSMLTRELGERDRITIVTYAGEAGLKLAPTNGGDHGTITSVINSLNSNGSTHGSAGIQLAYEKARESFIKEGTNRVILCTDGDLNVGITQDDQLVDLITKEAKSGVFLTVLGFGQGNLKDSKMEKLADHGNGVYAYIDGVREAKKVLVDQLSGSLTTIAKDVKIQIEFNPGQVRAYRLIGYENRILAAKDFNDDTKDAGEIGAGHTVTALYELVPAGAAEPKPVLDELKYQKRAGSVSDRSPEGEGEKGRGGEGEQSKELLTLKLAFKQPDADVSKKIEYPLSEKGTRFNNATPDFRFAASVAAFGMILRDSPHRGGITMAGVGEIAASSLGDDTKGYRAEFLDLVRRAEKLGKR